MTDLFHEPIRDALAAFLDAAPPARHTIDQAVSTEPRRPLVLALCALALAAVTAGAIVVARDDSASRTIEPVESVASSLTPTTIGDAAWQVRTDPSSISRSQVSDITGGPTGFVAVGLGVDDGKNQGRVWFSPDGLSWQEPALAQFDTMSIGSVVATTTAFYVLAFPNTDRVASGPGVLYSSADGITWTPLGNPPGSLDVVGDLLVSISDEHPATTTAQGILITDQLMQVSTDGATWTSATFVGADPTEQMSFPATPIVHSNTLHYVMTTESTAGTNVVTRIWSTADGRTWTPLPEPPILGPLIGTPDGPMLGDNTALAECGPSSSTPIDAAAVTVIREEGWTCVGDTRLTVLPEGSSSWTTLEPTGIPPTQILQPIASDGDALIMPVTTTSHHLTLVASYDGGNNWLPQAADIDLDPSGSNGSSPQRAVMATARGTTVFAVSVSSSTSTGPGTVLVVGHP